MTKIKILYIEREESKKKIRGNVKNYRLVLLIEELLYFGIRKIKPNYIT